MVSRSPCIASGLGLLMRALVSENVRCWHAAAGPWPARMAKAPPASLATPDSRPGPPVSFLVPARHGAPVGATAGSRCAETARMLVSLSAPLCLWSQGLCSASVRGGSSDRKTSSSSTHSVKQAMEQSRACGLFPCALWLAALANHSASNGTDVSSAAVQALRMACPTMACASVRRSSYRCGTGACAATSGGFPSPSSPQALSQRAAELWLNTTSSQRTPVSLGPQTGTRGGIPRASSFHASRISVHFADCGCTGSGSNPNVIGGSSSSLACHAGSCLNSLRPFMAVSAKPTLTPARSALLPGVKASTITSMPCPPPSLRISAMGVSYSA
mmetsp:Transcript_26698/g.76935  ORF Transcript_26698/g.76935 Transcript_26698/m.76935 type:complete len:330 (-) Transcript_26698:64-1053(-)